MDMLEEIKQYGALKAQIAELQAQADAMQLRVQQRAALAVRALMQEHGITEEQLLTPTGKAKSKHPPKAHANKNRSTSAQQS